MTDRSRTSLPDLRFRFGSDARAAIEGALARARDERWVDRLFERDSSLWSADPAVQEAIVQRLGWLDAPAHFTEQVGALEAFGDGIREAGFRAGVVAGMGGSSLAPEVLLRTFGAAPDWLALRVLDSTDPEAVAATVDDLDPLTTLFIVASKSGTTTEPLAFQADAWDRIERAMHRRRLGGSPGAFMAAITDPGKPLASMPHHDDLREVFLNPSDVGGRYAALTYIGLVPASLMGLDLDPFLAAASLMLARCREQEPSDNPGAALGLAMGALAKAGRDKLTIVADPEIASFGSWAEQLIAESTGKHGVGIVPVDVEPLGAPEAYGADRVFVRLTLEGSSGPAPTADGRSADALLDALAHGGHPVIRIALAHPMDLAGEFVRWEVAIALAGAVLGIDPFDQPNVEEAKENTRRLLADLREGGASAIPSAPPIASGSGIAVYGDATLRLTAGDETLIGEFRRHLARRRPNAYLALQSFIAPTPTRDASFARIRTRLRDRTRCATTAGYGPRFLHSTGQLHKGGDPNGWFVQLTCDHPADRPIPGWPFSFGQLIDAQAAGDFRTIEAHDLPILRVHLGEEPDAGLAVFERTLADALG
jgi:glucose-6-phosphate isomerase